MELSPQAVDAYKKLIETPSEFGFDFKPLKDCFIQTDNATPKHILFEQYVDYIKKPLPKIMFYIIMDGIYPQAKAPNGDLGYLIKFNS